MRRRRSEEIPAEKKKQGKQEGTKTRVRVINELESTMQKRPHTDTTANDAERVGVTIYLMKKVSFDTRYSQTYRKRCPLPRRAGTATGRITMASADGNRERLKQKGE